MTDGKLVRDGIPDIMRASGSSPEVRTIHGEELLCALFTKLEEEAEELRTANQDHQVEEFADVLEVVRAIAAHLGVDLVDVDRAADLKRVSRGGFTKGYWLTT